MSDLYPTPTRLDLLRQVDAGHVFKDSIGDSYISAGAKVNARIRELLLAGWVVLGARVRGLLYWEPTPVGRAVLFAAEHPDAWLSGPCALGQCDDCGARDCEHDCSHEGRRRFLEEMGLSGGSS